MSDRLQNFDYLDEHLPYMLGTLRYNFEKMGRPQDFRDWNAYFESFAVNARNLVQFLGNADTGNIKARNFVQGFLIRKGDIQGPLARLGKQVFHLGKSRPRVAGKFDLTDANKVFTWIEAGMRQFVEELSEEDRRHWNAKKADPSADGPHRSIEGSIGSSVSLASPSLVLVSSTSTSSSQTFRIVGQSKKSRD